MKHTRLLLLVSICFFGGCKTSQQSTTNPPKEVTSTTEPSPNAEEMTYDIIHQENRSSIKDESQLIIRDAEEWNAIWNKMNSYRMPTPEQPEVNFEEYVVLACFMGEKTSGGYHVDLDKIEQTGKNINVYLTYTSPGQTCFVTEALTQPVIIVKVPRTEGEYSFQTKSITKDC